MTFSHLFTTDIIDNSNDVSVGGKIFSGGNAFCVKGDIPPTRNSDDRLWITILSILTRLLFPEVDHIFLEYREVDDMTIEIFYFYFVEYKSWNGKFNSG